VWHGAASVGFGPSVLDLSPGFGGKWTNSYRRTETYAGRAMPHTSPSPLTCDLTLHTLVNYVHTRYIITQLNAALTGLNDVMSLLHLGQPADGTPVGCLFRWNRHLAVITSLACSQSLKTYSKDVTHSQIIYVSD